MNSNRLRTFQISTLIALVLYVLLLIYMALVAIPTSNPKWNRGLAEHHIEMATITQELQGDLRDAVHNLTWGLHLKNRLLLIFFVSAVCMASFLGWSLFMIRRLKREDLNAHIA